MDEEYILQSLMSYLGNKRKLIQYINHYIEQVKPKSCFDGFVGSGVVARLMKLQSSKVIVNDLEPYSIAIQKAYLQAPQSSIESYINKLNEKVNTLIESKKTPEIQLISKYYSPKDTNNIQKGERCFYSTENGYRLDHYISLLRNEKESIFKQVAIGVLLVKASIHTNTSGVFKGFFKVNDIGQWGGIRKHDLQRILRPITLETPILKKGAHIEYHTKDILDFWKDYNEPIDFVYYDPPYNQHPYGSNYFMLNVIHDAIKQKEYMNTFDIDPNSVSGIPSNWNRSEFNYKKSAKEAFEKMIEMTNAKYILVSYNDNGFISKEDVLDILNQKGETSVEKIIYKNLNARPKKIASIKVNEYLFFTTVK